MKLKNTPLLMNEAPAGDGGGAGGGMPAAPAPAPAVAAPSPAPAPASVLAAGAGSTPTADPHAWLPEKFRAVGEDGALSIEASAKKLAEAYGHAEKRIGSGDLPPPDVSGYKITVPEAHKDALAGWDPAADEALKGFLEKGHKLGMTQAMADLVVGEYGRVMAEVKAQTAAPSPEQAAEQTAAALKEVWTNEGEFDANVGHAFKAANTIAAKAGLTYEDIEAAGLGNNPAFLRLMAALGPELSEDAPVGTQAPAAGGDGWKAQVHELRAQKEALPEKDPRRQDIQAKINALYDKHVK